MTYYFISHKAIEQMWVPTAGTIQAFFRGNGTNVIKIAPETAIKLTFNDRIKRLVASDADHITPLQRLFAGAMSGAVAQVCLQSRSNYRIY